MPKIIEENTFCSRRLFYRGKRCYLSSGQTSRALHCAAGQIVKPIPCKSFFLEWKWSSMERFFSHFWQKRTEISEPGCNNYLREHLLYLFYCFFTCNWELAYHISGLDEQMCSACILPWLNTEQINFGFRVKRLCLMLTCSYNRHFSPSWIERDGILLQRTDVHATLMCNFCFVQ